MWHQHFQTISRNLFFKRFVFPKIRAAKFNILRDDCRKFGSNKFIPDFDRTDWERMLCSKKRIIYSEESDVNLSKNQYLYKIDSLLKTHAPPKKLNKKKLKFLTKS